MSVVSVEIKNMSFSTLSLEEKMQIKARGRATPNVEITQKTKDKG